MAASPTPEGMTVTSEGIVNGVIAPPYGKHGTHFLKGMPDYSFPLAIHNAPKGTQTFALFLEDRDAIPVARFSWIHWVAANLTGPTLEENASANPKGRFVQGVNSWASPLLGAGKLTDAEASRYGGMAPPDKAHVYDLHVYALDTKLPLKDGFFANDLFRAMEGHILAEYKLSGSYSASR
ncbi:MAG: YbhB/YbcL family Raf kinase inhibitor-like protein [Chthoniobacteraceae bacterium]|nr:YbhB/YbcL family Raf kinase inhibitor-like protein [Chthoniobacteraceae bacterium]